MEDTRGFLVEIDGLQAQSIRFGARAQIDSEAPWPFVRWQTIHSRRIGAAPGDRAASDDWLCLEDTRALRMRRLA